MKKSSSTKSIAFILWFVIFCSVHHSSASDGNIISTIKKPSADFTYRILPADVKPLYLIEAEDVEIKVEKHHLQNVKYSIRIDCFTPMKK